jgi:hypothetical protein
MDAAEKKRPKTLAWQANNARIDITRRKKRTEEIARNNNKFH